MPNFWKISVLFFFIWSLGPNLIFLGESIPIPLPLFFIKHVPLVNLITRLPVVSIMFFFCSTILSSYAIKKILRMSTKYFKYASNLFTLFLVFLIIFEYISIPIFITSVKVPEFYKEISKEKGDYAILELPVGECPGVSCPDSRYSDFAYTFYEYYQTLHEKKILGGYLARNIPQEVINFTETTPFIVNLKHPNLPLPNEIRQNISIAYQILKEYEIKYVILHKKFLFEHYSGAIDGIKVNNSYIEKVKQLLNNVFENEILYEDEQITVYEVK